MNSIENIDDFDKVVICNDSVYGPVYPLGDIFNVMSKKECDFWSMTDNYEIAYHLQSYFLVFKRKVVNSKAFKDFWGAVKVERTKGEVIRKYEVGVDTVSDVYWFQIVCLRTMPVHRKTIYRKSVNGENYLGFEESAASSQQNIDGPKRRRAKLQSSKSNHLLLERTSCGL